MKRNERFDNQPRKRKTAHSSRLRIRHSIFFAVLVFSLATSFAAYASGSRLLFSDANIAHLKTKEGIERVRALADRPGRNALEALCLAYRVTGDESYAKKAKEKLSALTKQTVARTTPEWGGG